MVLVLKSKIFFSHHTRERIIQIYSEMEGGKREFLSVVWLSGKLFLNLPYLYALSLSLRAPKKRAGFKTAL